MSSSSPPEEDPLHPSKQARISSVISESQSTAPSPETAILNDKLVESAFFMASQRGETDIIVLCKIFADWPRVRKLYEYSTCTRDKLRYFAEKISDAYLGAFSYISKFYCIFKSNGDYMRYYEYIKTDESMDKKIASIFMESILESSITGSYSSDYVECWQNDLNESLRELPAITVIHLIFTSEMQAILRRTLDKARCCKDDEYMEMVETLLHFITGHKQDVFPFVFLCAPSGTGKSIFGYNLGSSNFPMVFINYQNGNFGPDQELYKPFQDISEVLHSAILFDLQKIEETYGSDMTLYIDTRNLARARDTKFRTVSIIVQIFRSLLDKKRQKGDDVSWLEAQCYISELFETEMSLEDGFNELMLLRNGGNPFLMFLDECVIGKLVNGGESFYVFIRNMLRVLKIVAFFSGTNAAPSNLITMGVASSRLANTDIWAALLTDLPSYSNTQMEVRCGEVERLFPRNSLIPKIIDFVKSIRIYENPLILDKVFDFITDPSTHLSHERDLETYLRNMFGYIAVNFVTRKNAPDEFTLAQFYYVNSFEWKNSLVANHARDICIHRHLGYLAGTLYESSKPYILLSVEGEGLKYFSTTPTLDIDSFKPEAIFSPFQYAPLSGLVFFGFGHSENCTERGWPGWQLPFILTTNFGSQLPSDSPPSSPVQPTPGSSLVRKFEKLTAFDAILKHFPTPLQSAHRSSKNAPSGIFLENVFSSAALVASRCGGPGGAPFTLFLRNLIRQLTSMRTVPHYTPKEYPHDLPMIQYEDNLESYLGNKTIPLVAPMATPEWPKSLVDLLQAALDSKHPMRQPRQMCRLGTFCCSKTNEPVDMVVFEFDSERVSSAPAEEVKLFNKREERYRINSSAIKKLAMVAECKELSSNITLHRLKHQIVDSKFIIGLSEWNLLNNMKDQENKQKTECDLFIVLALSIGDFESKTESSRDALQEMNKAGFFISYLEASEALKESTDPNFSHYSSGSESQRGRASSRGSASKSYMLKYVTNQSSRPDGAKDLIVIPTEAIWGEAFTQKLYKRPVSAEKAKDTIGKAADTPVKPEKQ